LKTARIAHAESFCAIRISLLFLTKNPQERSTSLLADSDVVDYFFLRGRASRKTPDLQIKIRTALQPEGVQILYR
jgi:hypothetical protein